ncbi:MAG: LysM domain-containing protein [Anaerolineales bacterium]|jgi:LysM repeat protein
MDYKKRFLTIVLVLILAFSVTGFAAQPAQAASCAFYHTVSYGESLSWIGSYYGVSWTAIADANNIKSPYTIFPGNRLCIPTGARYTYYNPTYYYPTYYPYYYDPPSGWDYQIIGAVRNQTVTIQTSNFPDNVYFEVRIGCWNCGKGMTKVTDLDSDRGGTFKQVFNIPAAYAGYSTLQITLVQAKKGTTVSHTFSNYTTYYR